MYDFKTVQELVDRIAYLENQLKRFDRESLMAFETLRKIESVRSARQARLMAQQVLDQISAEAGLDDGEVDA